MEQVNGRLFEGNVEELLNTLHGLIGPLVVGDTTLMRTVREKKGKRTTEGERGRERIRGRKRQRDKYITGRRRQSEMEMDMEMEMEMERQTEKVEE